MARTPSWTGLPSITPQIDFGWPILAAECSSRTVSIAARPGATIFGPPEKTGEEMGLDESGGEADVLLDILPLDESLDLGSRHLAERDVTISVECVVLDHPALLQHPPTQHPLQLGLGARTMGTGGDEHRHRGTGRAQFRRAGSEALAPPGRAW